MNLFDRFVYRLAEWRASSGAGFHVSQTPPGWVDKMTGTTTASGAVVNEEKALTYSAVYACVRILAETLASVPWVLFEQKGRSKERARGHPLFTLLHTMPNLEMSSFEFREALMGHLATWGNAYAEIEFDRRGAITALWPLRPDRMTVKRKDGVLSYSYRVSKDGGSREVSLLPEQVFHLRGFGFDGRVGYSPIAMARQSIGLGLATETFGSTFFGNGARPGGVFEHPGQLGDKAYQRLKESLEKRHGGLGNSNRVAILEEGLKYNAIGVPPEEAQFLETRTFQVRDIARWYRVPPHMLADLDRATFSNIEHLSLEFVQYTMLPWFVRWEQAVSRSLLLTSERDRYYAQFVVAGLLRGDIKNRYEAYSVGRQNGWLSANDIRKLEDQNPIEGGDVYLVPLNMVPADMVTSGAIDESSETSDPSMPDETPENIQSDKGLNGAQINAAIDVLNGVVAGTVAASVAVELLVSLGIEKERAEKMVNDTVSGGLAVGTDDQRALDTARELRGITAATHRHRLQAAWFGTYQDVAARVLRREARDISDAARKYLSRGDFNGFSDWLTAFYEEHSLFVYRQFDSLAQSYGELVAGAVSDEIGGDWWADARTQEWIRAYLNTFAARHCGIGETRVRNVVQAARENGEDAELAVTDTVGTWEETRATDTARWESVRFNNALAVGLYMIAGRKRIIWRAFGENCPYCSSLNGRTIGINTFFLSAGDDFQPEGAERPLTVKSNIRHAPAHDGCDCMVTSG